MYAIKALYDGVTFKPKQPIPINTSYEVIITFVEPVDENAVRPPFDLGCMEGKYKEAYDHNWFDPLEDFEEYM